MYEASKKSKIHTARWQTGGGGGGRGVCSDEVELRRRGSGNLRRISTSLGSAAGHEPATVTAHSPKISLIL